MNRPRALTSDTKSKPLRIVLWTVGSLTMTGLVLILVWGADRVRHYQSAVTAAAPAPAATQSETPDSNQTRVLVFFDPSRTDCVQCDLHVWRFAYYSFQFQNAGAEVIGVAAGLRDGLAQLDSKLPLPWETLYDLSAQLRHFYGVKWDTNPNPVVLVVDAHGDVLYRGQPQDLEDRLEGNVLTTILAAQRSADSRVAQQLE